MLFDTHAHLTDERFGPDLPAVIECAMAAGVERVVCVATTAIDSPQCIAVPSGSQSFQRAWAFNPTT